MNSEISGQLQFKREVYNEALAYFREHADDFIEDVLEIKLNLYQKVMVRAFFKYNFLIWIMCRGTGKTWLGVLCVVTYCLLYPNTKAGIVAPSFRQARSALQEKYKDELCQMSPFLAQEEKDYKSSNAKARVDFYNNSWIEAFPIGTDGAKIRGARLHITLIDEAAYVPREIIDKVVTPMLIVKAGYKVGKKTDDYAGNKLLMTSTASYRFNHLYTSFKNWTYEMVKPDNTKYFTMSLPYMVGVRCGLFDESIIEKAMNDMTEMEFEMEYLGRFPRLVENAWIRYDDLMACQDLLTLECNGDNISEYIASVDIARMSGEDNTVIMVFKLLWAKDHIEIELVYIRALNGEHFAVQAENIREILRKFNNIIRIYMDTVTIGQGLTDELAKPYYYEPEDKWYPPIVDMNDETAMDNLSLTKAIPLIYGIKASPEINHKMGYAIKNFTEKRWLHMYSQSAGEYDHIKLNKDFTLEETNLIEQTKNTFLEVMNIETKGMYGSWVQFQSKAKRKDRWTALSMGCYGADLIKKERETKEDGMTFMAAVKKRH